MEDNSVILRLANEKDLDDIMIITKEVVELLNAENNFQWNHTYPLRELFEKDISSRELWVAIVDEQIAGFVAITEDQNVDYSRLTMNINERSIVPHRLAVSPRFRNLGIAQRFLKKSESTARERGYNYIRADTHSENIRMHRVFEKENYQNMGTIEIEYEPFEIYRGMRFTCFQKTLV